MKTIRKLNLGTATVIAGVMAGGILSAAASSSSVYQQVNLTGDLAGMATYTDPNLLNPWGIINLGGDRLLVADNHAGMVTSYRNNGRLGTFSLQIPAPGSQSGGAVTDLAMNRSGRSFLLDKSGMHSRASLLLFVTEDGTIAGWNPAVDSHHAMIAVNNSGAGAIYKSMSIAVGRGASRLFAANFGQGMVEAYDGGWQRVKSFTDPTLANASYVPFGMRILNGHLFVTFAFKAAPTDGDETAGPGLGYVDEFDLDGKLVRRFASQGTLTAPWGLAMAPHDFGKYSGALLIGNFGDGTVNAFNPTTGAYLGQIADSNGAAIQIEGLWGLTFGPGPGGHALYFTAGPGDEEHGLLGVIRSVKTHH